MCMLFDCSNEIIDALFPYFAGGSLGYAAYTIDCFSSCHNSVLCTLSLFHAHLRMHISAYLIHVYLRAHEL
jgi:hypothetical protein